MTIYSQLTRKKRKKNYALSLCLPVLPYTTSINDGNELKFPNLFLGKVAVHCCYSNKVTLHHVEIFAEVHD